MLTRTWSSRNYTFWIGNIVGIENDARFGRQFGSFPKN
jgi:hypothetical protein